MALDSNGRTLYVSNLDKNVSEELLYELFLQAGPIERVHIPNSADKTFRYGFVTYFHQCSLDYAIALFKGTKMFKKELWIKRKGDKGIINLADAFFLKRDTLHANVNQDHVSNPGKSDTHGSPLIHNSLKGHWSDRNKPYDRFSRSHYRSRNNGSKNHSRKHEPNNKYRDRKQWH